MGRVNHVAVHTAFSEPDVNDTQPHASTLLILTYAVVAAMAPSSAHIISVQSSGQSAPWDDPAQALGIVRSGLQHERYLVLNVDQGVSLAAQVCT